MKRLIAALMAMLLILTMAAGHAAAPEELFHNYILLIDNSKSTTGRHSLGGATDPKGLRFDAARLVFENVVTSAATGSRGQIGLIVFCGPDNCVTYGPVDVNSPNLEEAIGQYINESANADYRDAYTDIRTALQKARQMMRGFTGSTSVILLTDGVNDLTNRGDPFKRPENIRANDETASLAGQIASAGGDFHVIALTSDEKTANDESFAAFIDQLAKSGGGERQADGSYDNVLNATQDDLSSKLLQMLVKAEGSSDTQNIIAYTPVYETFQVPYDGISEVTVSVTFSPEDKDKLFAASLVTPAGDAWTLWDRQGCHDREGITVRENRSYVMFSIPNPMAGAWTLAVAGAEEGGEQARVLVNAVARLNHHLRLRLSVPESAHEDEIIPVEMWVQGYDGREFKDLTGSGIYGQSTASVTLYTPDGKQKTGDMTFDGDHYTAAVRLKNPGEWKARAALKNPYVQEKSEEALFELLPAPTPTPYVSPTPAPTAEPTPVPEVTPTPTPEVAQIGEIHLEVAPVAIQAEDVVYVDNKAERVTFAWKIDGATDRVDGELLEDGKPIRRGVRSGNSFDRSGFKPDSLYTLRVSAMPKNGAMAGVQPTVATLNFRIAPQLGSVENLTLTVEPHIDQDDTFYIDREAESIAFSWTLEGESDSETGEILADGQPLCQVKNGEAVPQERFNDEASYEFRVTAMPKNGNLLGAEPETASLSFKRYPQWAAVEGLTLNVPGGTLKNDAYRMKNGQVDLAWSASSGNVDHYELNVTGGKGGTAVSQSFPADASQYSFNLKDSGDYTATLTAMPRYARSGDAAATAEVKLHIPNFLEKFWPFIAGGAGLLAALAALAVVLLKRRQPSEPRVEGTAHLRCEELSLDTRLTFAKGSKGLKPGDPIVNHPDLARLKGQKAYELLKDVRVSMVKSDGMGKVAGVEEVGVTHRPNDSLLRFTVGGKSVGGNSCCVGSRDVGESTLLLTDAEGQAYVLTISGVS